MDGSAEIGYNESEHWLVCGDGCDAKLNAQSHTFGKGSIVKEATADEEGILSIGCTECDYEKEETIPKTSSGHTHAYTVSVIAPGCTSGGYTTHTCSCGHTWTDGETSASEHVYEYKMTEDEHWQECTSCHKTTDKTSHKLSEWKTVKKPGYTFSGEKQRVCRICGHTITETIPMLRVPEDKFVVIIPEYPADSSPEQGDSDTQTPGGETSGVKELLTKGEEQAVPALPTLPATKDGNLFDGWADKESGEFVKKGDKISGNVELVPVWKDCGAENHTDKNDDTHCDICGYILKKEPEETTSPEDSSSTEPLESGENGDDSDSGSSGWLIGILSASAGIAAVGGGVLFAVKKKKNKEVDEEK